LMYANDNAGLFPPNDAVFPHPTNGSALFYFWYTTPSLGRYVGNRAEFPHWVTTKILFCPAVPLQTNVSTPVGHWNAQGFGIGYNVSSSIRTSNVYRRYPNVLPSDPSYATQMASFGASNLRVAKLGRIEQPAQVLLFTDVDASSYRFIQMYNGHAGTLNPPNSLSNGAYLTNPRGDAVSYRHNKSANVAFMDGHVSSFKSNSADDNQLNTHRDTGIHAEWKAGRLNVVAR
jgi:prepilin-type processing-associated H-X9-DG protein